MELAGCMPGGAIETERLKEISAKASRDGGLYSPLERGCRGGQ